MKRYQLPIRPDPYPDESAAGLLIRLTEMNGHNSVYQMISGTGFRPNVLSLKACLIDPPRYRQLTDALGLGEDAATRPLERTGASRLSPRRFESTALPDTVFRRDDARAFCPMCLKDAPYWRQRWQIRPFAACLTHRRLLLDSCSECSGVLDIARGELARCNHCRASLLSMRGRIVNVAPLIKLQEAMESARSDDLEEILGFWTALVRFDGLGDHPKIEFERVGTAISFFTGDGNAIKKIARQVKAQRERSHPRIQLLPFLSGSAASVAFAEAILAMVPPLPTRCIGDMRRPPLSKIDVCKLLQITAAELSGLIQSAQLKWPSAGRREQKVPTSVIEELLYSWDGLVEPRPKDSLEETACTSSGTIKGTAPTGFSLSEAAAQLGVTPEQVEQLLRKGVLKRTVKRHHPKQVDRSSLWKLLRTLRRTDLIPLHAAADALGNTVSWIQANWAANGIITILDFGLWRFVSKTDIEMVSKLRGKYMTATEAGRALGIHRTLMMPLEKMLLIDPFRFGKNRDRRLYVRTEIRALARTCEKTELLALLSRTAASRGLSARH